MENVLTSVPFEWELCLPSIALTIDVMKDAPVQFLAHGPGDHNNTSLWFRYGKIACMCENRPKNVRAVGLLP
jgi:hypothetical protein